LHRRQREAIVDRCARTKFIHVTDENRLLVDADRRNFGAFLARLPEYPDPEGKQVSRKSIAVYFYTKERPESEVAPDHATIYVHPPLPGHIRPGDILSEGDYWTIRALLERRDHHIKFLYEREKEFSAALEGVLQSRTFRIARLFAWPLQKFRKTKDGT
jgi:hypothetical protein